MTKENFFNACKKVNQWVFDIVKKYNGSISAEHGIGLTKSNYLSYSKSYLNIYQYIKK